MVEYILSGQLIIEVWGSQKEIAQAAAPAAKGGKAGDKKSGAAAKSTKELMAAEKAKVLYHSIYDTLVSITSYCRSIPRYCFLSSVIFSTQHASHRNR